MTTINPLHPDTSDLKFTFDPFLKSEYRFGLDPSMSISSYITSSMPLTRTFLTVRYAGTMTRATALEAKHVLTNISTPPTLTSK